MNPAETYILNQEEPFRTILLQIQVVVAQTIPEAEMLFKYRIPFYYLEGKRPFCYLNCAKGYVDMGFWNAAHLTIDTEYMVSEGRKHIKSLRYYTVEEINHDILVAVLKNAYEVRDKKFYS